MLIRCSLKGSLSSEQGVVPGQTHSDSYASTERNKPNLENWKSQITCVLTQDKLILFLMHGLIFFFVVVFVSCYCWAFFSLQLLFRRLYLGLRAQFHHYVHIKFACKFSCKFSVASPSDIFHGRTTHQTPSHP